MHRIFHVSLTVLHIGKLIDGYSFKNLCNNRRETQLHIIILVLYKGKRGFTTTKVKFPRALRKLVLKSHERAGILDQVVVIQHAVTCILESLGGLKSRSKCSGS